MKVRIKDLKPNPFRDMANYPINPEKIESLKNSIEQTGFWDNILARKSNGNIEIAYGHHRLQVLKKLYKLEHEIDIPVKEIDDPTMIKIMANENDESWGTSPKVIDETVRVAKKYLEEHPEIAKQCGRVTASGVGQEIISRFLGGNWKTTRIQYSLERIRLSETEVTYEKHIDREAVETFTTEGSARSFVKAVKNVGSITPEQQRRAAKRAVKQAKKGGLGELAIKKELLDEKVKHITQKEEKRQIEFSDYLNNCRKLTEDLSRQITRLLEYQDVFHSEIYRENFERNAFVNSAERLIDKIQKLIKKGDQDGRALQRNN